MKYHNQTHFSQIFKTDTNEEMENISDSWISKINKTYMGNEDFSRQMQGQRRVICLIFAEDFVGKRVPLVSTFGKNSLRPLNKSDVLTSVRGTFDAFRTGKVAVSSRTRLHLLAF